MKINNFLKVEKKYNLQDLQINGFRFWVYYRSNIEWKYVKKAEKLSDAHIIQTNTSLSQKIISFNRKMRYMLTKTGIPLHKGCTIILDHPRRVLIDGIYKDIYTDELSEKLENTIVLEKTYQNMHMEPVTTKNLVYTDIVDYMIKWYSLLTTVFAREKFSRIRQEIKEKIDAPIQELDQYYGVKMDLDQLVNEIAYCYLSYKVMKKYYTNIFRKVQPCMIIEVVSYCMECMVVNEIADEFGIPSVELQHGTMGVEHLAYNYLTDRKISQFPNYIFTFSDFWKQNMSFPIDEQHVIATGYPYLEQQYGKYIGKKDKNKNKVTILFLSSGPIAKELEDTVVSLYEKLDNETYHIIYKLHPGEYADWDKRYTKLAKLDKVEVIAGNRKNLYELFAESDIQVSGYNSTTIFEGLYFGLRTYIINCFPSIEVDQLCRNGYATYFNTAEELYSMIVSGNNVSKSKIDGLWQENAMENMLHEIELIQKGKI